MKQKHSLIFDAMTVDRNSPHAIHQQVYDFIRGHIVGGQLTVGSRLPSTRTLALHLRVGRNSTVLAYEQLSLEGYIESRAGAGTCVTHARSEARAVAPVRSGSFGDLSYRGSILSEQVKPNPRSKGINLFPGLPSTLDFPFSKWAKIVAKHARSRSPELLSYSNFGGLPRLRKAIAEHIAIARGVSCSPSQVIVTTGAQAGLDLLVRLLCDNGDQVWMEEPGYSGARAAFLSGGVKLHPLRVVPAGWRFSSSTTPRLIYVTPACQWPTGAEMSDRERLELLGIAEESNVWIIEDDYDGEYRLRGNQVPSLQASRVSDRVIYLGTFGKTIFSSLRIGFMVVPAVIVSPVEQAIQVTGQFAPLMLQAALAEFIEQGHFAGHLRHMRAVYAERQRTFRVLCEEQLSPWMSFSNPDSGIQLAGRFKHPVDDRHIASIASSNGLDVLPLSTCYFFDPPERGLLLGYAQPSEFEAKKAVEILKNTFVAADTDLDMEQYRFRGRLGTRSHTHKRD